MATTQNCLALIDTFSESFALPKGVKWKRKTKYKVDGNDVREFINPEGNLLVIVVETEKGDLSIRSVISGKNDIENFKGKASLIGALNLDVAATSYNLEDLTHLTSCGLKPLEKAMSAFIKKYGDEADFEDYEDYDLLPGENRESLNLELLTRDFMLAKLNKCSRGVDYEGSNKRWRKEFGIYFDLENVMPDVGEFKELPGFKFIKVSAGGDWEIPITLFLYTVPSDPNLVQTYVPLDKGNLYLKKLMCAVGSGNEFKHSFKKEEIDEEEGVLNEFYNENMSRLEKEARESFKEHLIRTEGVFIKK